MVISNISYRKPCLKMKAMLNIRHRCGYMGYVVTHIESQEYVTASGWRCIVV